MASVLETLRQRGCVHDVSHFEELNKLLEHEPISFYCGFDPTSDSLHVGSMLPLLLMRRLQQAGHTPIVLLGAATGIIGDPSGKSEERKLLDADQVHHNAKGIEEQVRLFLSSEGPNAFRVVRNDTWLAPLQYIEFLRDVGKHFSVNSMLAKESVKARLENREQGISYTEFSYMLLQAYDYSWLYTNEQCRMQVGGSDQWGNITAGLELIRRTSPEGSKSAFGLTFPLLMTSSGTKFGKTEKGAVWLSPAKTSAYQFYQFWLNTSDEDVTRYLQLFTTFEGSELAALVDALQTQPQERLAQRTLAGTLTELVHGKSETERAVQASNILFGASFADVSSETLQQIFSDVPSLTLPRAEALQGIALQELLVRAGAAQSKGAAKRLIEGGGVYVNNEKVKDAQEKIELSRFVDGSVLVARSGKKNHYLVRLE